MKKIFFEPNEDILDPCFDGTFKAMLCKDTPESRNALQYLLSGFVRRSLEVVTITANEPTIEDIRDRRIRYDISCKFENGELANIEMTMHPNRLEPYRIEFYASKLLVSQEIRGRDKTWQDLKMVYQISFLAEGRLFDDNEFLHHFRYYDEEKQVAFGGHVMIITVEMEKLEGTLQKSIAQMSREERWAVFFKYCTDKSKRSLINQILAHEEGIAMAAQTLLTVSRDEVERARLLSEYKYEVDHQSDMIHARREGRAEGREMGHEEGREVGRAEERHRFISIFRSKGMSDQDIAEVVGCPIEEISDQ